jgi:predicted amidophosphoribosyltransferase
MISCPTCNSQLDKLSTGCHICGQVFCQACHEPAADDTAFCSFCDEQLLMRCSGCKREISRSAAFCPECGLALHKEAPIKVPEYTRIRRNTADSQEEAYSGACPRCTADLYIEDGYCGQCGQSLCTSCGQSVDENDDICSACGIRLFFSCPLCDFELTAGTEMCPNCDALFPTVCSRCGGGVQATDTRCQACRRPVAIQHRHSARTIHSFLVGQQLIRMIACPGCGRHLNPATGPCTSCGENVCAECQLILMDDERICPRCGYAVIVGSL